MASDFSIQFSDIPQAPTIFPDEIGVVNVTITNQGDTQSNEPVTFNLYASTDKALDKSPLNTLSPERGAEDRLEGTDELLGTEPLNLAPGESKTITIDFASPEYRTASVVSPGAYYLIGEVIPDNSSGDTNTSDNPVSQLITQGDVVIQWNSILLNAIQASGKGSELDGTPPPLAARNQAIVHTAIYDAVNDLPEGASVEAAVVGAAYQTLKSLFPDQTATFDEQRGRSLNEITNDPAAEDAGFNFGVEVANRILTARSTDFALQAQDVPYTPGNDPGDFQPIGGSTPLLPGWERVTPFAIDSASQFRPDGPPDFGSPQYGREIEEVRQIGALENTDITTITRSADQTEVAQFWAYDRDDTFRPPGQLNEVVQEVALAQGNTLEENARLFALVNIAQADAGIVAWDAKYTYDQLRPITAIEDADNDNNPITQEDPNWSPLLATPNFPDYISGHSVFAGATAQVLAEFYGTDNISFNIPSQELPGVARSYSSFSQLAQEDADSRIYGGIHNELATADGVEIGQNVGNFVFDNALT